MLGFLFRRLTADPTRATPLFDRLTAEARRPEWYIAGRVPDTISGRFAVLATVVALALVRFENDGEAGDRASVGLTERFIHVMESEHRELGISDPKLGRTVRKLVAMLARRTELLRSAVKGDRDWTEAVRAALYGEDDVSPEGLTASAGLAWELVQRLQAASLEQLERGALA